MPEWESALITREQLFAMNTIKNYAAGKAELGDVMVRMDHLVNTIKEEIRRICKQEQEEMEEHIERMKPPVGYEGPWAG